MGNHKPTMMLAVPEKHLSATQEYAQTESTLL